MQQLCSHRHGYMEIFIFLLLVMNIPLFFGQWIETKWFWKANHSLDTREVCIFALYSNPNPKRKAALMKFLMYSEYLGSFLFFCLFVSINHWCEVSENRGRHSLHLVTCYSQKHHFENHQVSEKGVSSAPNLPDDICNDTSGDTASSTLLHDRLPFSR